MPLIKLSLALVSGLLFGCGLILAGMSNPAKVLAFLDLGGLWDPSLALVMLSAISLSAMAFWLMRKRQTAYLGDPLQLPVRRDIDRKLILGSLLFGIGWGIAGICPGPALVMLMLDSGGLKVIVFLLAMMLGMRIVDHFSPS